MIALRLIPLDDLTPAVRALVLAAREVLGVERVHVVRTVVDVCAMCLAPLMACATCGMLRACPIHDRCQGCQRVYCHPCERTAGWRADMSVREVSRGWLMIRGAVVASLMDRETKKELLALIDAVEPERERCGGTMRPTEFTCPECGPEP